MDLILTDPPYSADAVALYSALGKLAARVLRPGGVCAVYSGQAHLPKVIAALSEHVRYVWTCAVRFSGGRHPVGHLHLHNAWKPIFIFTRPPLKVWWQPFGDMLSGGREKMQHEWQQAGSEASELIEHLCPVDGLVLVRCAEAALLWLRRSGCCVGGPESKSTAAWRRRRDRGCRLFPFTGVDGDSIRSSTHDAGKERAMRFRASSVGVSVIAIVGVGALATSGAQQSPRQSSDPLVQEVRLLREAVERHSTVSAQVQLTVQRGNAAQTRLSAISWELADVRNQLSRVSAELARDTALVKELDEQREHPEQVAGYIDAKRRLEPEQKMVLDLRNREAEIQGLFAAEQSRWEELNRRLDELGRLLGAQKY